jgi:hypothetical protein
MDLLHSAIVLLNHWGQATASLAHAIQSRFRRGVCWRTGACARVCALRYGLVAGPGSCRCRRRWPADRPPLAGQFGPRRSCPPLPRRVFLRRSVFPRSPHPSIWDARATWRPRNGGAWNRALQWPGAILLGWVAGCPGTGVAPDHIRWRSLRCSHPASRHWHGWRNVGASSWSPHRDAAAHG